MSLCDFGSWISDSVAQDSMLMKPGATARLVASISSVPFGAVQLADRGNGIAGNSEVSLHGRIAGAVVDHAVPDDGVVLRRAAAASQQGGEQTRLKQHRFHV